MSGVPVERIKAHYLFQTPGFDTPVASSSHKSLSNTSTHTFGEVTALLWVFSYGQAAGLAYSLMFVVVTFYI